LFLTASDGSLAPVYSPNSFVTVTYTFVDPPDSPRDTTCQVQVCVELQVDEFAISTLQGCSLSRAAPRSQTSRQRA
jgi:hypothetical protein